MPSSMSIRFYRSPAFGIRQTEVSNVHQICRCRKSQRHHSYRRLLDDSDILHTDNGYDDLSNIVRKNFVLMESSKVASTSAMVFSIAETANANQLITYGYFKLLLTEIPKHMDDKNLRFLDNMLP